MIFAMLVGELPPRALVGIDERSSVGDAKKAVLEAFKEDPHKPCRLSADGAEMGDESEQLARYGVQRDALLYAELVSDERRAEAPVRL
jgi:hypothetical protein